MSNKRHTHRTNVKFNGNVPKAPVEWLTGANGNKHSPHTTSHMIGNAVYHSTKGFRVLRKHVEHRLLFGLLLPYQIVPYEVK